MLKKDVLKIGIDGRALVGNRTGVGRYIYEICLRLDKLLPEALFFIYSNAQIEMPNINHRWILRLDDTWLSKRIKKIPWLKLRCGHLCEKDNLDVFWGPMHFLPRLGKNIKRVLTVHDFFYRFIPKTISKGHYLAHKYWFSKDLKSADTVVVNSLATADKLKYLYGISSFEFAPPAINPNFKPSTNEMLIACLSKYKINFPYFLSVATWNPRKNLETLIHAFLKIKKSGLVPKHKLVLVGEKGWHSKRLIKIITKEGNDNLFPLGFVNDEDLPPLYSGAEALIFPSLYEGFGIPVLEARACGTKVIATDIPELREAGGPNEIYIQPTQEGIIEGISKLINNNQERSFGKETFFNWENTSRVMANIFSSK